MADQLQESCPPAALEHLTRGMGGVSVDGIEMIGDVPIGEVMQFSAQLADTTLYLDRLVHMPTGPFARPAVVEAQLIIRIPVRGADPSAQVPRDARDAIPCRPWRGLEDRLDFVGERCRDALVGVNRENPIVCADRGRVIFLRDVSWPRPDDDPVGVLPGDPDGIVRALGIDDNDFVGPGDRLQGVLDMRRFVLGDDRHRQLRHPGILREPYS